MADYILVVDLKVNLVDVQSRVARNFENFRSVADNAFVIRSTQTTSKGISETIFGEVSSPGRTENHAVFRFNAFWGFHDRSLWEWLDTREPNDG